MGAGAREPAGSRLRFLVLGYVIWLVVVRVCGFAGARGSFFFYKGFIFFYKGFIFFYKGFIFFYRGSFFFTGVHFSTYLPSPPL